MSASIGVLAALLALPTTDPRRLWIAGAFVVVATVLVAGGVAALLADGERQAVLARLTVARGSRRAGRRRRSAPVALLRPEGLGGRWGAVVDWIDGWLPEFCTPAADAERLVQAGLDHQAAPVLLGALRLAAPPVLALLVPLLLGPAVDPLLGGAIGALTGVALPGVLLDGRVARRRQALLRALPDTLDVLVVCLEAGLALDAALLRVGRDLHGSHPTMAEELGAITRRVAAGIPREEALRGLHARTGVPALRELAAVMIQADRWGTSLARVLRIHADSVRSDRRQRAERTAQEASVKMIFPIVLFLLPAFFAIILGPAALTLPQIFR